MKCLFPSLKTNENLGLRYEHRCGQCANCRITRGQEWTARLLAENTQHEHSTFITLTYSEPNLPEGRTLVKRDLQLFFKILRKQGYKFRYYAVGEYGPQTKRPHYHAILFGIEPTDDFHGDMVSAWAKGEREYQTATEITMGRCSYVAKYCLKKQTQPTDFPDGRTPEFALMSRRPGLGVGFIEEIAKSFGRSGLTLTDPAQVLKKTSFGGKVVTIEGSLRLDGKKWPLDAFMRAKLLAALEVETSPIQKALIQNARILEADLALGVEGSEERRAYDNHEKYWHHQNELLARTVNRNAKI